MLYTCSIIKNEHRYLREWIDHCLSIGFDEIHLYEDEGSESHTPITDAYPQVHLHSIKEVPRTDYDGKDWKQVDMAQHFISTYSHIIPPPRATRPSPSQGERGESPHWCAFIDPDEYIRFDEGYTLSRLCEEFKDYRGIYLQYKIYGANGHVERPEGGVVENYGGGEAMPYRKWRTNMKSLVNLSFRGHRWTSVHKVQCGIFTDGKQRRRNSYLHPEHDLCYEKAWIDHYYTKSWEDWTERFTRRGDVVEGNVGVCDFFLYNPSMLDSLRRVREAVKVNLRGRTCNQLFIISAALNKHRHAMLYLCGKELDESAKRILNLNAVWWTTWSGEACVDETDGYCQDASLHDEAYLRSIMRLPKPDRAYDLVIHLRREDYLSEKYRGRYVVMTKEYIERVVAKYYKGGSIAFVSTRDGLEWAREQCFSFHADYRIGTPIEDLSLIANARTVVCSGSSFSVMGCMLNARADKQCIIHLPYDNLGEGNERIIPSYFHKEPIAI